MIGIGSDVQDSVIKTLETDKTREVGVNMLSFQIVAFALKFAE